MMPAHWPKWIVIPIGLALAVFTILIALILESAAQALMPRPTPRDTLTMLHYAAPQSRECILCHTQEATLRAVATSEEEVRRVWIDPADVLSTHGRLGCITCHGGNGGTTDLQQAHAGVVKNPTLHSADECIICHANLPDEFPEKRRRAPHTSGLAEGIACSDCHGAVGHGPDPLSGHMVLERSRTLNLDARLQECYTCHIGPHDVAGVIPCSDCHVSLTRWNETHLAVHPVELTGQHAQIDCFDCHRWPNFGGLRYVCSDCHPRPHEFGDDNCQQCHVTEGWKQ